MGCYLIILVSSCTVFEICNCDTLRLDFRLEAFHFPYGMGESASFALTSVVGRGRTVKLSLIHI